jgi:hypothetical protein
MENDCERLYCHLQMDLADVQRSNQPCAKKIEAGFKIAVKKWMELSEILRLYHFNSQEEEIHFFKTLKPKFTSEIEYYTLVYHAILFKPAERSSLLHFWGREYGRLRRFKTENKTFIKCYLNNKSSQTPYFFLRKYYTLRNVQYIRLYDSDVTLSTNGDWLVAKLLALEKYRHYAVKKLERI